MSPFYFELEKRKGMSKWLELTQHFSFKTLRRRLLLGAGSCIFFSKPKKKTAPGCWVT
jgi:hypothetical protein